MGGKQIHKSHFLEKLSSSTSWRSPPRFILSGDPPPVFLWGRLPRILPILDHYQVQWFSLRKWNLLWVFLLAGFMVRFRQVVSSNLKYLAVLITGQLLIYTIFYVLVPNETHMNLTWYLKTTVSRMFLHLAPLTVFFLAAIFGPAADSMDSRFSR